MKTSDSERNASPRPALAVLALSACLLACGVADAQQPAAGLQTIQVMDQQVGLPALSIALPRGWTHQFKSTWNKNNAPKVTYDFEAKEPGGAGMFYINRSISFYDMPQRYGQMPFIQKLMPPRQALEYVLNLERQSNPVFRAKGYRVVQSQDFPPADINGSRIFRSLLWADYTENGVPMQELVNVVVVTAPPGTAWTLSWNGLSDRKGVPPEALRSRLDAISGSVFNLPQWLEKKAAVLAQWGNEDEARAALALARSNAIREQSLRNTQQNSAALEHTLQANRERNQAQEEARTARQSAIDRNWERSTDTVVGRDNRRNPYDGTQFKSDVNTEYVWVNKDGRKIGTNNSTYNPNYDSSKSGDWQLAPKGY